MRAFVGIPLTDDLESEVEKISQSPIFQKYLRRSRLEPHLTLKAPQVIPEDKVSDWIEAASSGCRGAPPQKIILLELSFLTPMTLCIRVETEPLCDLHLKLVEALEPFETHEFIPHEGPDYIAHITVGRATAQILAKERQELLRKLEPIEPRTIIKSTVRLYGHDSIDEGYRTLKDIELSGS